MLSIDSYSFLTILFCKKIFRNHEIQLINYYITDLYLSESPVRRQAIIWSNNGSTGPSWTNFNEILIKIRTFFSCTKLHLKMTSAKWKPFCLGLTVLINKPSFTGLPWRFVSLVWSASAFRADDKNEALEFKTWTEWPPFCRRHFQTDFAEESFVFWFEVRWSRFVSLRVQNLRIKQIWFT